MAQSAPLLRRIDDSFAKQAMQETKPETGEFSTAAAASTSAYAVKSACRSWQACPPKTGGFLDRIVRLMAYCARRRPEADLRHSYFAHDPGRRHGIPASCACRITG
jgi:hypothetical protein